MQLCLQRFYLQALIGQAFFKKLCCAPSVCLAEEGVVCVDAADSAVCDNLGYAVDMVYIAMAHNNRVDPAYCPPVEKRGDYSCADVTFVQRARVEQDVGFARKLEQYRLAVAYVETCHDQVVSIRPLPFYCAQIDDQRQKHYRADQLLGQGPAEIYVGGKDNCAVIEYYRRK